MTNSPNDRQILRRLTEAGSRFTSGRRLLVGVLADGSGPRTAAELADALGGSVPLSSLYRSLAVLDEAGVVVQHFGPGGVTRYELAEWLTGHHHHLVCIECGGVEDIALDPEHESEVRRVVAAIGSTAAFEAEAHALEIEGRCARCA